MLYKVIDYFGPKHSAWNDFAKDHWIQPLESFDSIDGILCEDLFTPETDEDWEHGVKEDFRISMITDVDYARRVSQSKANSRLVGLIENSDCDGTQGLLGYDLLDVDNHVSLITNWGPEDKDHPLNRFPVGSNGLFQSYDVALKAAEYLKQNHPASDHPLGSIWAIFVVGA